MAANPAVTSTSERVVAFALRAPWLGCLSDEDMAKVKVILLYGFPLFEPYFGPECWVSYRTIEERVCARIVINGVTLRRILVNLERAGLVELKSGGANDYRLWPATKAGEWARASFKALIKLRATVLAEHAARKGTRALHAT